jgi:hypothetical protein
MYLTIACIFLRLWLVTTFWTYSFMSLYCRLLCEDFRHQPRWERTHWCSMNTEHCLQILSTPFRWLIWSPSSSKWEGRRDTKCSVATVKQSYFLVFAVSHDWTTKEVKEHKFGVNRDYYWIWMNQSLSHERKWFVRVNNLQYLFICIIFITYLYKEFNINKRSSSVHFSSPNKNGLFF